MPGGYPDDWDARRRQVYGRDEWTCQNCGRRGGPYGDQELHCHHIVPKGRGGSHRVSNLVTLCEDCHKAVHNRYKTPARPPGSKTPGRAGPSNFDSGGECTSGSDDSFDARGRR